MTQPRVAPTMHVADISMTDADFKTARESFKRAGRVYWTVRIADQNQKPVAAALAECELARTDGAVMGLEKAMTGTDGMALFSRSLPVGAALGRYAVRVKTISHYDLSDATYLPAANLKSLAEFEVR